MRTGFTIAALAVSIALAACSRTLDPPTPEEQARETHAAIVSGANTLLYRRPSGLFRDRRRSGAGEDDLLGRHLRVRIPVLEPREPLQRVVKRVSSPPIGALTDCFSAIRGGQFSALNNTRACIARLTRDGDVEGSDTPVPGVIDSARTKEHVVAARAATTGGER